MAMVVTSEGKLDQRGKGNLEKGSLTPFTKEEALRLAVEKNKRATNLGIKTRYRVEDDDFKPTT